MRYVGVKIVKAIPMTDNEAKEAGCLKLSPGAELTDHPMAGYAVEYEGGYRSWCPKSTFEMHNRPIEALPFSHALELVKKGKRVARKGWNGKGMFVFLVPGSTFKVNRPPLLGIYPEGTEINYHAHIDMKTADGQIVPWLASQTDILADDWEVVE